MGPICIRQPPTVHKVSLDRVVGGQITKVDESRAIDVWHTPFPQSTHSTCLVDLDEGFPSRVNSVRGFACMSSLFYGKKERKIGKKNLA